MTDNSLCSDSNILAIELEDIARTEDIDCLDFELPPETVAWAAKKRRQSNLRSINRAISLFKRIGLPFQIHQPYDVPAGTFFPGCWLERGKLHFAPGIADVGQILHEAGHLALLPRHLWNELEPGGLPFETPLTDFGVEAWDYCAAKAVNISGLAVFEKNFDGAGFRVWERFEERTHPGIDLLEIAGMAKPFPHMKKWFATEKAIRMGDELASVLSKAGDADELATLGAINQLAESWQSEVCWID